MGAVELPGDHQRGVTLVVVLDAASWYDAHAMSSLGVLWCRPALGAAPVAAGAAYLGVQRIQRAGGQPRGQVRSVDPVEVVADLAQGLGAQGVVALPAALLDVEQTGLGEQTQVPADRRAGDRLPVGQVDDPHRLRRDRVEQLPSYGIGKRSEDIHSRKVTVQLPMSKRIPDGGESCAGPRGAGGHLSTRLGCVRETGEWSGQQRDRASAGALPKVVGIVAGVAVALVLLLSFIVLIGGYRWVPGVVDCTVRAGDRTVDLTDGRRGAGRDGLGQVRAAGAVREEGRHRCRRGSRHLGRGRPGRRRRTDRAEAARPDLPARRRGRRGAGPAQPLRAHRASRHRPPGHRPGLRAAAGGWLRARWGDERAHARVGALRGPRRRCLLPAGEQAQPRQGMGDRAVPRGPRRPAVGEHGDLRRPDLDAPAVDPGLAGVRRRTPRAGPRRWPPSSSTATTCTSTWPTD